jgi:hypothetical protein
MPNRTSITAQVSELALGGQAKVRSPEGVVKVIRQEESRYAVIFDGHFVCDASTVDDAVETAVACLRLEELA